MTTDPKEEKHLYRCDSCGWEFYSYEDYHLDVHSRCPHGDGTMLRVKEEL